MDGAYHTKTSLNIDWYIRRCVRMWPFLVMMAITLAAVGWFVSVAIPQIYEARGSLLIRAGNPSDSGIYTYEEARASVHVAKIYRELMDDKAFIDRAAQTAGLDSAGRDAICSMSVELVEDTSLLQLTVQAENPQAALFMVSAMIYCLNDEAGAALPEGSFSVINEPVLPMQPMQPRRAPQYALLGAFCGLMMGLAAVCFMELRADTVQTVEDVESIGSLVTLIPCARNDVSENPGDDAYAGAFNGLAAHIGAEKLSGKGRVILVTSAGPGEGKTTCALNLAIALANQRRRVLLIDADTDTPDIHQALSMEGIPVGLGELLSGEKEYSDVIQHSGFFGFNVLPAGRMAGFGGAGDPGRLEPLFKKIRGDFDYVLIDAPSAILNGGLMPLGSAADIVLFVLRQDVTPLSMAREAVRRFPAMGAPLSGFVLNCIRVSHN